MRSKYTGGLQVGYKWDTQYFPGRNNANPDALNDRGRCAILPIWETTEPGGLPSFSEGLTLQTKERRALPMYVTYSDLIQIGIFICALVGLCYTIFKGKRK